jgi:glucan 1,4-alpha-glucosidase
MEVAMESVTRLRRPGIALLTGVLAVTSGLALGTGGAVATAGQARAVDVAPGAPGALSYFDLARKDCVGTAAGRQSKVWYTVAGGVLSDTYEPTIDNTDVSTLQYIVTDGSTFTDLQTRDMTYTVAADPTGMACTVTAADAQHGYQLITTYITDPARDTVLMHTRLAALPGSGTSVTNLHLYARLDAHVNGNGGGGSDNAGGNTGVIDTSTGPPVPVIYSTNTVTNAANRDYAVPTYMALDASLSSPAASVGYAGSASDGLDQLDATHALTPYDSAPDGHIVATEDVTPPAGGSVTLALGFGRDQASAVTTAARSLQQPFGLTALDYEGGWLRYDAGLRPPFGHVTGAAARRDHASILHYYLSANVIKASEDKTYPGAIVASLASPWGQSVPAGNLAGGVPGYFGSYREVFARDLYEAYTGLLVDGDLATARAATLFLFDRQQQADGSMPRNSLLNGKPAPDTGGTQLDETSYPIIMALQAGLGPDTSLWLDHIRPAADFLVAHGPSFGVERWEEQTGYSPSTIAAEIAGLTAASMIAAQHGDPARARVYQAAADDFQRNIKSWTVTTNGSYGAGRYFIRLSRTGDPNAAISYNLGNGGPELDQRAVLDGGFQELVRLGELPVSDPDVQASLGIWDKQIAVSTPSGTGYYRYGNSAALGSADGYGDCYRPSQTSCSPTGAPWAPTGRGTGHLWPVLSGERAESDIAGGNLAGAASLLTAIENFSSGVGLVPEQAWENPDLPASPFGSDPLTASIGFTDGKAAGSASPLTWAQAQELRLILALATGHTPETPQFTVQRYVAHGPPGSLNTAITAPVNGSTLAATSTTVTGTTAPGATVTIESQDSTTGAASSVTTTTAAPDGSFSATVPIGFGSNAITAGASTDGLQGTGYAQVTVSNEGGGTTVLDVSDPAGDDNGPGTYQYPTYEGFRPGAFDLTRFQVLSDGTTAYLRATIANLTPTFGQVDGAQLLDVYVHTPGATTTSTAAAFGSRNYTITSPGAWSQRLEVQGFAPPVWQGASGNAVGTAAVLPVQSDGTITIALPEAQFGTPGPGWGFSVVLTGQDGFSPDLARGFAATAQDFLFGVCVPNGTAPICKVPPGTVPKAVDVITPAGVSQATELDPTLGPVTIQPVVVP